MGKMELKECQVSMEVMGRLVHMENQVLKETQVYQVCQEFKALLGQRVKGASLAKLDLQAKED